MKARIDLSKFEGISDFFIIAEKRDMHSSKLFWDDIEFLNFVGGLELMDWDLIDHP